MSLKEAIEKIEEEEELLEIEDRIRGIQHSIYGLCRRIDVIVEYIDRTEKEKAEQSKPLEREVAAASKEEATTKNKIEFGLGKSPGDV